MDVGEWLRSLGLSRYEEAFREAEIGPDVLPDLTDSDLEKLGVPLGDRKRLLKAIASFGPAQMVAEPRGPPPTPSSTDAAERRQLTVMFCDLVGSTALSTRLDPEDMREVIAAYQKCVSETVRRFGGFVAKYMGDGVLVYFGYPGAHEHDAERAVQAGLALVEAVGKLNTAAGVPSQVRVGIATGLVVVGDLIGEGAAQEQAVIGETPNLAARLQTLAEPGAVIIADSTRRLIGDLFELSGLDLANLKGFAEPVLAWRVVGEGRAESRFEALHGTRLAELVGRDEELHLILSRWRQAKEGDGQVVLICGEPGIGKSRLVIALRERLQAEPNNSIGYACSPHHANSPFFPFIAQLERAAGFAADDTRDARIARLETLLGEAVPDPGEAVALFAELLGIEGRTRYALGEMSPLEKKSHLFRAFLAQIDGLAARGPVLMVLEDAHWLDASSSELFNQIVDRVQRLPALLVVTFRPELSPSWIGFPHVTLLTLNRLAQAQARLLIERVIGNKMLPAEVVDQILARTEGMPLFAEELTKAVLESGLLRDLGDRYVVAGPLPPFAIPATLHDSLMARLDRSSSVKEIAQIAACIGREFDHELLAVVVSLPEAQLVTALDRLAAAELIFRRGVAPGIKYVFKHALVRDAAYESLLRKRRQEFHARIAMAIESRFPQLLQTQPELVARHFGEARLPVKATGYWLQAGRLGAARSANVEAIAHLRSGLECVREITRGDTRSKLELSLQLALGGPLIATKGFASSEAEVAYRHAEELSRELHNEADLFRALRGLGHVYHVRANLRDEAGLVTEAIDLARRSSDPAMLVEAYHFAGNFIYHSGAFQTARDWFQQSMAAGERYHSEVYGINIGVFDRAYIGHCDWHLGYPDRALQSAEEGLMLAREVSHPFSIALALNYLAMLRQFRREPEAALNTAEEAHELCAEYRFDYYGAWSALVRAWAVAEQGRLEEGLMAYHAGLDAFRATGAELRMPHYLGLLAAIHRKAGRHTTGLQFVADAAAFADKNQENWCDAQLEHERGELLLLIASGDACEEADSAFRRAIETASAQGAKLLELRASASRARYWAQRGNRQKARDMLVPIYGWFTEGFDTPDLVAAKRLLEELQ